MNMLENLCEKMDKIKVNNQVILMRKFVKQAKIHIMHRMAKEIKLLKNKKGNENQILKNKRKAERLHEKILLIKKMKPDSVSKLALSKAKDWDSLLKQKNISLQDHCLAMLANFNTVQKEVEKFHSTHTHLVSKIPSLILEWEVKCQNSNFKNNMKKNAPVRIQASFPNNIKLTKEIGACSGEKRLLSHLKNNLNVKETDESPEQMLTQDIDMDSDINDNGSSEAEEDGDNEDINLKKENVINDNDYIESEKDNVNDNENLEGDENSDEIDSENEESEEDHDMNDNESVGSDNMNDNNMEINIDDSENIESNKYLLKQKEHVDLIGFDKNIESSIDAVSIKGLDSSKSMKQCRANKTKHNSLNDTNDKEIFKKKSQKFNDTDSVFKILSSKCTAPKNLKPKKKKPVDSKLGINDKLLKLTEKSNKNNITNSKVSEPIISHKNDPFFLTASDDLEKDNEVTNSNPKEKHFDHKNQFNYRETDRFRGKHFNDRTSRFNNKKTDTFRGRDFNDTMSRFNNASKDFSSNKRNFNNNRKEDSYNSSFKGRKDFKGQKDFKRTEEYQGNNKNQFKPKQFSHEKTRDSSNYLNKNKNSQLKNNFKQQERKLPEKNDEPLHPSWQAKRKLKEAVKTGFAGKRIVFDD